MCVVAGNNPDEIMKKYSNRAKVEPYCVYKFNDIEKYRQQKLSIYETILQQEGIDETTKDCIRCDIDQIRNEDDIDFYTSITENLKIDENTGDAYSDINLNGKFDTFSRGIYAMTLLDSEGNEHSSLIKKDVDFNKVHLYNQDSYRLVWELGMEGRKPADDEEKLLYERVRDWQNYFTRFGNKENYVLSSTAFWAHAFTDGNNWYELEKDDDQYQWIGNYYDRFIKPLSDDTLLTIYEFTRG